MKLAANTVHLALVKLILFMYVPCATKITIYMYVSEGWPQSTKNIEILNTFERKTLRRVTQSVKEAGVE